MITYKKCAQARSRAICIATVIGLTTLTACQTTGSNGGSVDTSGKTLDAVLAGLDNTFAQDNAYQTNTRADFLAAERAYKQNPDREDHAVRYADALRKQHLTQRAALVLMPYIKTGDQSSVPVLNTYAAILLEQGAYDEAEIYANRALRKNPKSHEAYQNLGIALDAQGQHERAEAAFRKGLNYWHGDPLPILNNLALSLAAQGYMDDAIDILRRASTAAPQRQDIERNLRIITALNKNIRAETPRRIKESATIPAPRHKPQN